MSVFTTLTLEEVKTWLQDYAIGEVTDLKGIAAGITNTNYFVTTNEARYVLTIFEANSMDELPYYANLMTHYASKGIPCPQPITDKQGVALHLLKDKPALLVSCLNGATIENPNEIQCAAVGRTLAEMHLAGATFKGQTSNPRGAEWRLETSEIVLDKLSVEDQSVMIQALDFQNQLDLRTLPRGVIHADLFRDNVLFDGDKLGGFIDFYYACSGALAYDVAIAVNDWCLTENGDFDDARLNAFMQAYIEVRPFTEEEQQMWQGLLCIAALRFWLSRLYDLYFPAEGELTHAKDPDYFKNILLKRAKQKAAA